MNQEIVELNIGGSFYTTSRHTLLSSVEHNTLFHELFETKTKQSVCDSNQRVFLDRDGCLFKFILDYLRNDGKLVLPECFDDFNRLKSEANFYKMSQLEKSINDLVQSNRNRKRSILNTDFNDESTDSTTTSLTPANLDVFRDSNKTSLSPSLIPNKNWNKNYSGCILVG
jgi:BTB/POZ domain-containing protein KCTD8/12/16